MARKRTDAFVRLLYFPRWLLESVFSQIKQQAFNMLSMPPRKYLPHVIRAIASSYLIRQTAGSERVGGLEVSVKLLSEPVGKIRVKGTFMGSDEVWESMGNIGTEATNGIVAYAKERSSIRLEYWDIELSRFLFHPVDSRDSIYFFAAQNAFRAAL